jgi:protocatechuate 3,4-dioxygenase beta subunit
VATDDQGKFQLKDLEPGTYRLYAVHNGFARMEYGQKLMYRPGTPLNLTAGQTMKDVAFRLTPSGTITGRILDDQGDPIPGVSVQVLRSTYDANGKRTLQPAASAKTNDLGEYRLYYVAPGRYYVSASVTPSGIDALVAAAAAQQAGGAPTSNEVVPAGYVLTYYPNTPDPSRAQAIEVQPGSEISAIHFTLARQQRFRVKGRVLEVATGKPPMNATLTLSPRNSAVSQNVLDTILGAQAGGNNYNSSDGSFELRDVSPGSYWLQVLAQGQPPAGTAQNSANAAAATLASLTTAMLPVEVSGADIENLTVTTGNGITIPGTVQIEGTPPAGFTPDRVVLVLIPSNGVVSLATVLQQVRPSTDGAFSVEKVNSGQYRFAVGGMSPTMFLKSARFDKDDILADGFSVADRSPGALQVTLSAAGGQIQGNVLDQDSKPVRGITTVLIPDRNRDRRDVYKIVVSDQNGHFNMRGVAPGDYKLFAWEDIEPFSYNDPEVLKQFEDKGRSIHIDEMGNEMVDVRLIPAPAP